jgi:Immunity protein 53
MANELDRLQRWYLSHCNGDWEHTYGVTMENIDNPGWTLTVQLAETTVQDAEIPTL